MLCPPGSLISLLTPRCCVMEARHAGAWRFITLTGPFSLLFKRLTVGERLPDRAIQPEGNTPRQTGRIPTILM
ncbi:hypothetical protein JZ751_019620 [Albula glossodonta]|uniref:Uncharacterized protein n=1 Tax=Albula glossodonta TaxID=121402 RepID=A0A8T2NQ25_9TELE|nr:hypothetical protein JZ751_019620 [Albula glossodonta]